MADQISTSWVRFLQKLRELVWPKLSAEEQAAFNSIAAGHAGGSARADRLKAEREASGGEEKQAHEEANKLNGWPLLAGPFDLSEDGKTVRVQIFPKCGTYSHPRYGDLQITPEFLAEIKQNFDARVYQQELPLTIDLEHQTSLSGAAGWIKEVEVDGQKGAWATIELNDRGRELVQADAYRYFSPEYYDSWTDPASNKEFANLLAGGALTNRPFFKGMEPVVVASEGLFAFTELSAEQPHVPATVQVGITGVKVGSDDKTVADRVASLVLDALKKATEGHAVEASESAEPEENERELAEMDGMAGMQAMMGLMAQMAAMMPKERMPEAQAMMGKARALMAQMRGKSASEPDTDETDTEGGEVMGMTDEEARQFAETQTALKTLAERLDAETEARKLAEGQARAAVEKAASLERANNRRALTEEVHANRAGYVGEVEAVVDRLEVLQAKLSEQEFTDYLSERRELGSRLSESELLKQHSGTGVQSTGAVAEFEAAVSRVMSEQGKTQPEALQIVVRAQPELYARYDREHNSRARKGGDN